MPKRTPALRGQAEVLAQAAAAAADWFSHPNSAALSSARAARQAARDWRENAVRSLKDAAGPAKSDDADLSFALREAVESAVEAASEAAQWGVGADKELAAMAGALRDGAKALVRAAGASGAARAEALIEAKRWAAAVERRRRAARAALAESPSFVEGVKRGELAERLSASAEDLQRACDALAGSLGA